LPAGGSGQLVDTIAWRQYTTAVLDAVREARARGSKAIVVTQPYASDTHRAQQAALAAALTGAFAAEPAVRYVNLGALVDLRDPAVAYDGLHLTAAANRVVATHLLQPVLGVLR
jgi:DNA-binding MurR/RpiR family transcriptional regulator